MKQLTDLRTLSLNDNKFQQLPDAVLCYSKLYSFSIKKNQLSSLPDEMFAKLPELETIAFDNNKLQSLPYSLKSLRKLKKVTYLNNPMASQIWL
jgi:Leucine-rich repeat (LRR) protein